MSSGAGNERLWFTASRRIWTPWSLKLFLYFFHSIALLFFLALKHISGKHTCLFFIRVPCLIPLLGFYVTDCPFFLAVLYDHVYFEFLLPPLLLFLPTLFYQICVIM